MFIALLDLKANKKRRINAIVSEAAYILSIRTSLINFSMNK
jgi:hypothetical protein